MSGYVFCMGTCCACGEVFSFNPHKVPSIVIEGHREPVCQKCVTDANPKRKAMGLEEFVIHPDAYEAIPESEL